jgi:hypothetical protein
MDELKKQLEIKKNERDYVKKNFDELVKEYTTLGKKIEEAKKIYYKIEDEYYNIMTQIEIEKHFDT